MGKEITSYVRHHTQVLLPILPLRQTYVESWNTQGTGWSKKATV
jgi:hypothetical protein